MTRLGAEHLIDVTFNVSLDAGGGDPDRTSPTLKRYHQLLWSKPLPDGTEFTLDTTGAAPYLYASVGDGHFLSSDSIVHSYRGAYRNHLDAVMAQVPPEHVAQVDDEGSTIGGFVLFPGDVRDGKPTINGARGMHPRICDRIDLTLECIRRHYTQEDSPLAETLNRYKDFFKLFGPRGFDGNHSFRHYVEFFLLDDLVEPHSVEIRWYLPFDHFNRSPLPQTPDEYETYRQAALRFVRARNRRILEWSSTNLP